LSFTLNIFSGSRAIDLTIFLWQSLAGLDLSRSDFENVSRSCGPGNE